jgi:hypothetical protein
VNFENSQPKNGKVLKQFPEKLIGKYEFFSDTLIVEKFYIEFPSKLFEKDEYPKQLKNNKLYLSDSTLLKYHKNKFFLNIKSKDNNWSTYLLKVNSLNNIVIGSTTSYTFENVSGEFKMSNSFERENQIELLLDSLGYNKIDVLFSKSYNINPSKKQLKKLIELNLFWELMELKKIK